MRVSDNISSKKILDLMDRLRQERTLIRVQVPGTGYEGLTIITGLVPDRVAPHFFVDAPPGIAQKVRPLEGHLARFDFLGPQRVPHAFSATLQELTGQDVRVHLPSSLERAQQRQNFRIPAPDGVHLAFAWDGMPQRGGILNISLGGTLIRPTERDLVPRGLTPGDRLKSASILTPTRGLEAPIVIQEARVIRSQTGEEPGFPYYAIVFDRILRQDMRNFEGWINRLQRRILQEHRLRSAGEKATEEVPGAPRRIYPPGSP